MNNVESRIQRLEDIEDIRQLKARYLHSCDQKDVANIRACFYAGKVHIDYGALGCFDNRDAFLQLYQQLACNDHIIDMHHGQNAQIEWQSASTATAKWDLFFHQIDTQNKTLTQLAGYYEDNYLKHEKDWQINATTFRITSTYIVQMDDTSLNLLFAGRRMPAA